MEEAIADYLLNAAGLTALVAHRIEWVTRTQGSLLPSLVLTKVDGAPEASDEGADELAAARLQVDCYGATYAEAKDVSRQVMAALSGVGPTIGEVEVQGSFAADEQDSFEIGAGGEQLHRVRLDFEIWHSSQE